MKHFYKILFVLLGAIFIVLVLKGWSQEAYKDTVRSDGRGYYAYLPALFIFQDPDYEEVVRAENRHEPWKGKATYLNDVSEGRVVNKYFPGAAILQLPFFLVGALFAWIFGFAVDGYSFPFLLALQVASWFYTLLGLWLVGRVVHQKWKSKPIFVGSTMVLILMLSPLYYYTTNYPSLSHVYSFFLFGAFLFLLSKESILWKWVALVLVLIVLVRPPNALVVLFIPYLLGWERLKIELFNWKSIVQQSVPFLSLLLVYPLLVYWQTGRFAQWSYTGEGFVWGVEHWWDIFFSYRCGLFLHNPVYLLSLIVAIYQIRKNVTWLIGVGLIGLIFSCWWCWDYESLYGLRPMTEFAAILVMPIFDFWATSGRKSKNVLLSAILLVGLFQWSRFELLLNGMYNQRFTKDTYWVSLFHNQDGNRFKFHQSCPPKGAIVLDTTFFRFEDSVCVNQQLEFAMTSELQLREKENAEMEYLDIQIDKFQFEEDWGEVYLVLDAKAHGDGASIYHAFDLYEDRVLDAGKWKALRFQYVFYDKSTQFETIKVYLWNPKGSRFAVRNLRYNWKRFGG